MALFKGQQEKNLLIDKLNILPLICYEIIFTDLIQKSENNTNLIVNISEDGWFGKSIGQTNIFRNLYLELLKMILSSEVCQ